MFEKKLARLNAADEAAFDMKVISTAPWYLRMIDVTFRGIGM